ncbi:DNA-directed RNA polymerase II subunit rpb7 [Astathelohania contejeani]|uniref:DNA-directed RNA polymerase II subunit rpb7 n=1 Tax=Astathelohania contejeani TaxID=164912 RepID=A0ABQ7I2X4_9MICR|nr:DNA-directed RNA polymerase II subunit rpb7 [Thelohania contejeani]
MFFIGNLRYSILLDPSTFGPNIEDHLRETLVDDMEGTCSGEYGYIIAVLGLTHISEAEIQECGRALIKINYKALLLKPLKGEVLDASVVEMNKMGIFASIGPMTIFISNYQIPQGFLQQGGEQIISRNSAIRLKIIGTKVEATKIYAIGTINEDCLGIMG